MHVIPVQRYCSKKKENKERTYSFFLFCFSFLRMMDPLLSRPSIAVTRPYTRLSYDVTCSSNAPLQTAGITAVVLLTSCPRRVGLLVGIC